MAMTQSQTSARGQCFRIQEMNRGVCVSYLTCVNVEDRHPLGTHDFVYHYLRAFPAMFLLLLPSGSHLIINLPSVQIIGFDLSFRG